MTIDFNAMIFAHSRWKTRLKNAITGGEQIDPAAAGKDDQCDLGRWLAGQGAVHAHLPACQELKLKHTKFHASVAQVLRQSKSSPPDKVGDLIDPLTSDFARVSRECIDAIRTLQVAVGGA